ncbi:MAG: hypothetical protein QOG28_2792 [Trebonia sp.]|nr:hypothetical protein [Trebonia sp.]
MHKFVTTTATVVKGYLATLAREMAIPAYPPKPVTVILEVGPAARPAADHDCWGHCDPARASRPLRTRPGRICTPQPSFLSAPWPSTSAPSPRALPGPLSGGQGRPQQHSALTPPARRHDLGVAGPVGQARGASADTGRPAACAPKGELSDVAEAPAPPGSGVDRGLGWPDPRLGDRGLAGRRRGPASLLQPDGDDDQRDVWPRRNRSLDHDGGLAPGGRLSARDCRGPGRRPGACPRPARRRGPVQHRHRRMPRTRSWLNSAAPRLDCARRGRTRAGACLRRPARTAAAADPEQLRLCSRDRRVHCLARLACHRNPGRQRPGPG